MESETNQYKEIIFPENSANLILKILERYELKETDEEVLQKLSKKEKTIRGTVAEITKKVAQEEISSKEFSSALLKNLGISKKIADNLADDIEKEILILVKRNLKEEKREQAKKEPLEKKEIGSKIPSLQKQEIEPSTSIEQKPNNPKNDLYREPLE